MRSMIRQSSSSRCAGARAACPPRLTAIAGFALACLLGVGALGGCEDKGIGRICSVEIPAGTNVGEEEVVTNTHALECPSRICLKQGAERGKTGVDTKPFCTAECSSDKDCDDGQTRSGRTNSQDKRCQGGFVCGVPQIAGHTADSLCCKKMCICKDFFLDPSQPVQIPPSCRPNAMGLCPNRI
jgi:hypothetical protein